jgi:hypothetical protein
MWPWEWLFDPSNPINKVGKAVYDFVYRIISTIMGWLTGIITAIWATLYTIAAQIANMLTQFVDFVASVAWTVAMSILHAVQQVEAWVGQLISNIWGYIWGMLSWISSAIAWLELKIYQVFQDMIKWVYDNVIHPIWDALNEFRIWATHWILVIGMYINHPELLIDLIGATLWRLWTQYVVRYGSALARWMLRSMMGMAGEIFDLLEHILTSII